MPSCNVWVQPLSLRLGKQMLVTRNVKATEAMKCIEIVDRVSLSNAYPEAVYSLIPVTPLTARASKSALQSSPRTAYLRASCEQERQYRCLHSGAPPSHISASSFDTRRSTPRHNPNPDSPYLLYCSRAARSQHTEVLCPVLGHSERTSRLTCGYPYQPGIL